MLICIILLIFIILTSCLEKKIYNKFHFKNENINEYLNKHRRKLSHIIININSLFSTFFVLLSSLVACIFVMNICVSKNISKEYEEQVLKYEKLCYILETIDLEELSPVEESIIKDINIWNKKISILQRGLNSIWFRDYVPKFYNELKLIEY